MLPAILHSFAFFICLNVQSMGSPLAGAWLFFHIAGCAILLYDGKYPADKGPMWYACLCWLITLGAYTFLINPITGCAAVMFVLASAPSMALCLRREHLKSYIVGFGTVIGIYAVGLIVQALLHVKYSVYTTDGRAWPLMDPNNGACVLNIALIPALYLALFKNSRWWAAAAVVVVAMCLTLSKAGICAACAVLGLMLIYRHGAAFLIFGMAAGCAALTAIFYWEPGLIVMMVDSFRDRYPIWASSWPLLWVQPIRGLGLGMFGFYYHQVATEHYTGGWYAHNDLLQIAIEMGIPGVIVFVGFLLTVAATTCKTNFVSGLVILAVTLQALVEFQFYVPAITYPLGLVLGWHIINKRQSSYTS